MVRIRQEAAGCKKKNKKQIPGLELSSLCVLQDVQYIKKLVVSISNNDDSKPETHTHLLANTGGTHAFDWDKHLI